MKKVISVILSLALAAVLFTGCSNNKDVKYSDSVLIIGYTENEAPFIEAKDDGTAEGFIPELFEKAVFEATKGDFKTYRFEKVEKGYALEEDGGRFVRDETVSSDENARPCGAEVDGDIESAESILPGQFHVAGFARGFVPRGMRQGMKYITPGRGAAGIHGA